MNRFPGGMGVTVNVLMNLLNTCACFVLLDLNVFKMLITSSFSKAETKCAMKNMSYGSY